MKNQKQTIRKIVGFLNDPEEEGGFWLPNIQRSFVWTEAQICKLFDSILREYPISTLLVWKTASTIRHRKFIDNWRSTIRLSDFYVPSNHKKKCLILDGQQRLQSLFIGLCGSIEGKELCFNILSGELVAPDDVKYVFEFRSPVAIAFPWVRFKDLVFTTKKKREILDELTVMAGRHLNETERNKLEDHVDLVDRTFKIDEAVTYQELDSIDNPSLYTEDDVVEIFIRANSGGTKLGKSDLLFSLLSSSWDEANMKMEDLLTVLNGREFSFDRDFVLKTCLVLLKQGARYDVAKFRKPGVREAIEGNWAAIEKAINDVRDFVVSKTYIRCGAALPTYLVLIPLVYLRYHHRDLWRSATEMDSYVLRCSLAGSFGGQPDNLLDAIVDVIDEKKAWSTREAFDVVRSQRRSLEITEDRLWQMGYGSTTIHLLFNLWYRNFHYTPNYQGNLPQVDHVFPQSALKDIKVKNPETGRMVMKYDASERDQLANCMLLTKEENGPGGKGDKLPEMWLADKDEEYLNMHLIPKDQSLWKMDYFEDFIDARKRLIREKFKWLLVS